MGRLRIGTRGSALARAQAGQVGALLGERNPGLEVEIAIVRVSGDAPAEDPSAQGAHDAAASADKRRWVDTIEDALLAGQIDLAVHSAKDVPGELAEGLALFGAPARAAAEDVLCGADSLDALPPRARLGTSSIRRAAQLGAARADLEIVAMRGNVDTRLRKLATARPSLESAPGDARVAGSDGLDAIVLARAGLQRLGRESAVAAILDPERFVPAPGQGVLALEGRAEDMRAREAVKGIVDKHTFACLLAERALARALLASCHTPLGAHATPAGCGCLLLRAWVGLPDGSAWIADELAETEIRAEGACLPASVGGFYDPESLGRRVAERLRLAGAEELLRRAEEMATMREQSVC
jgi:hydroxymethylbilane synthase